MRIAFLAVVCLTIISLTPLDARAESGKLSTELRILHTNHYRIHTDLDRSLTEDLARRVDAMYEEYARRLAIFDTSHSGDKYDLYFFARRKTFEDFTNHKVSNAGGVTIPELNCFAADLESQGRDALRQTLQHEMFHQFALTVVSQDLPPWLNEGLAVMFQEGIYTGRSFILGQVPPRRVRQLQYDISKKQLVDFRKMMTMKLSEWNGTLGHDRVAGSTQYNQAWAMCQFLVYASDHGQFKYRGRFLDLLQRIHNGTDPMQAFNEAFSPNVEGFQSQFLKWASTLAATPEAVLIERQNVLGDMLISCNSRGRRFDAIDAFRNTVIRGGLYLQYTQNNVRWETERDAKIYFCDLDGRPYSSSEMYFDIRTGAPLPDLVCDPIGQIHLRTRFYDLPGNVGVERETIVEGGGNGR